MTIEKEPLPALFGHCQTVYTAMLEQAQTDEENDLVYEGFLTRIFKDVGLSVPYYTYVVQKLKAMGCIEQLRRGASSTPSKWLLVREPSMEYFDNDVKSVTTRAQRATRLESVEKQNADLGRRLSRVEEALDILLEMHAEGESHVEGG